MEHRIEVTNTGSNFEQLIYKVVEEECKKIALMLFIYIRNIFLLKGKIILFLILR